jgi:membrane-bound lytic murein transglycosylase D
MQLQNKIFIFLALYLLLSATPLHTQSNPPVITWKDTPEELEIAIESQLKESDLNTTIQQRLKKIERTIPLDYNDHTQKYIDNCINNRKGHFAKILARAEKYFPIYEKILAQNGAPDELKYLSVVESALNPYAKSPVGATGPWQFMYSTGLGYDLAINKRIDERKDPYEATAAAARYLNYLHRLFDDWLMAIAAYNCGPGGVQKAIKKSGGKNTYWEIRPFLPKETQGYVPSYIATVYIMKYAKIHGIYANDYDFFVTERVTLTSKLLLTDIEKVTNLSREILIQENPSLLTTLVPEGYKLSLPKSRVTMFKNFVDSLYTLAVNISAGDKLAQPIVIKPSSVSKDLTCETISEENKKPKADSKKTTNTKKPENKPQTITEKIKTKVLDKFTSKKEAPKTDVKAEINQKTKTNTISQSTNTTNTKEYINNLARIKFGLPPKNSDTIIDKSDNEDYALLLYTIKSGDNPGYIASWYHIGIKELKEWNNIDERNLINIGQELEVYIQKNDIPKFVRMNRFSNRIKDKLTKKIFTQQEQNEAALMDQEKAFKAVKDSLIKQIKDSLAVLEINTIEKQEIDSKTKINKPTEQKQTTKNQPLSKTNDGCYQLYTIKSGENLWTIAKKLNTPIEDLKKINKNLNFTKLKPGQQIHSKKLKNCNY